jgi:hypothetical protein
VLLDHRNINRPACSNPSLHLNLQTSGFSYDLQRQAGNMFVPWFTARGEDGWAALPGRVGGGKGRRTRRGQGGRKMDVVVLGRTAATAGKEEALEKTAQTGPPGCRRANIFGSIFGACFTARAPAEASEGGDDGYRLNHGVAGAAGAEGCAGGTHGDGGRGSFRAPDGRGGDRSHGRKPGKAATSEQTVALPAAAGTALA